MEEVKRNLSKIIKAKTLCTYPLYLPELTPGEEETFRTIFHTDTSEEASTDTVEKISTEEALSKQEDKRLEEEIEELRQVAREEGFRAGFDEGYRTGFEKGYEEGKVQAQREFEVRLKEEEENLRRQFELLRAEELGRLSRLLTKIEEEFRDLTLNLDREIVAISKALLQRLILREMRGDEGLLLRIVREALNYIVEGTEIIIHLNPEDQKLLEGSLSNLSQSNRIRLIADETITRGGLFIETRFGAIDATFERRLENLLSLLEGEEEIKISHEVQRVQG